MVKCATGLPHSGVRAKCSPSFLKPISVAPSGKYIFSLFIFIFKSHYLNILSVAEWLASWTQSQKGLGSNHSLDFVG